MKLVVTLGTAFCLFLTGCSKSQPSHEAGAATKASTASRSMFGPGSYAIKPTCPSGLTSPFADPFIITLGKDFELRDAKGTKSGQKESNKPVPNHNHKTRIDLATGLKPGQYATIKIILADSDLSFRDDEYAVRGGDPSSEYVYCKLNYKVGDNYLSFTVYRGTDANAPTYSTYNLGLIVKDKDKQSDFVLPVFIDPGTDNNGIE